MRARENSLFDSFQTLGQPQLVAARSEALEFCRAMEADQRCAGRWLSLLGPSGTGKTHLAKAVLKVFLASTKWVAWVPQPGVVNTFRSHEWVDWRAASDEFYSGRFSLVDVMSEAWLLIVDDIGADHDARGLAASKLDRILNTRLGMWTVLTSNLSLAQIRERLDARIASRMLRGGSVVCELDGVPDFNLR